MSEARSIAVAAQLPVVGDQPGPVVAEILDRLGCIQLDSLSPLRRSHELVLLARGATADAAKQALTEKAEPVGFETWAHAMSLVPFRLWPYFARHRRRVRARGWKGPAVDAQACDEIRERLNAGEAVIPAGKRATGESGWTNRSSHRVAADWLLWTGEAACIYRSGWKRVFIPHEQAIPDHHRWDVPSDSDCIRELTESALRAIGIGTVDDIADYFRLNVNDVKTALRELEVERVRVEGWTETAWIAPQSGHQDIERERTVVLSPFDSLVWYRPRQERLFDRRWLLEAYKPAAKREFGYFGMPILVGSSLAGRVALRRRGRTLIVEAAEWDSQAADRRHLQQGIEQAAHWTDTDIDWQTGITAL